MEKKLVSIDGGIRIVILQRGWVAVGHYFREGVNCRLENCAIIRRWGTTMGLPELAEKGALKETVLEKCKFPIRFHRAAEVATLDCDSSKWGL